MGRKVGRGLVGIIGGFLFGIGIYILLMQFGTVDPTSRVGLAFPILGVLLGIVIGVSGPFRRRREVPPPP